MGGFGIDWYMYITHYAGEADCACMHIKHRISLVSRITGIAYISLAICVGRQIFNMNLLKTCMPESHSISMLLTCYFDGNEYNFIQLTIYIHVRESSFNMTRGGGGWN